MSRMASYKNLYQLAINADCHRKYAVSSRDLAVTMAKYLKMTNALINR